MYFKAFIGLKVISVVFLFRPCLLFGWESVKIQDTILIGTAEHSKAGAVVITDHNEVYYIEGKMNWYPDGLYKKRVRVCGKLKEAIQTEESLGYKDGVYQQGMVGRQLIITNAVWVKARVDPDDPYLETLLKLLQANLPKNWKAGIRGDTLAIIRDEPVYLLSTNRINAPVNTMSKEEYEDHVKKHGRLIRSRFEYRLKPRFSNREMTAIQAINSNIENLISGLPDQYKISHLRKRGKRDGRFIGRNENENRAIEAYEIKKQELIEKKILLPEFVAGSFALFLIAETGIDDFP